MYEKGNGIEMSKIIVKNSGALRGEIAVSGSKNSALPIIAACILTPGKNTIESVPSLSDIGVMFHILERLGAKINMGIAGVEVDCTVIKKFTAPYELVGKMRGSFLLAGPLLARLGRARIAMPGGCPIGTRPVDLHIKGFVAMGAEASQGHGYIDLKAKGLNGARIYLDFPSVGATENLIMAAVLAKGETIIENAAAEPEIVDLADFLTKQGAKISGAGSDTVHITGVAELTGTKYRVIPDRIEAGTYMAAFAATRGSGRIRNVNIAHVKPVAAKLQEMGVMMECGEDFIDINAAKRLSSADIKTLPFPGFPTDMQAPFSVLLSTAEGTGVIVETVFENRFLHIGELKRMGANIRIDGRTSVVEGVRSLSGAQVNALDLRGGAALVIAGLAAKGDTQITGVEHIARGYEDLVGKLTGIGAIIEQQD